MSQFKHVITAFAIIGSLAACKHQEGLNSSSTKTILFPTSDNSFELMYTENDMLCVSNCIVKENVNNHVREKNQITVCSPIGSLQLADARKIVGEDYGKWDFDVSREEKMIPGASGDGIEDSRIFSAVRNAAVNSKGPPCDDDQFKQYYSGNNRPHTPLLICARGLGQVALYNPFHKIVVGTFPNGEDGLKFCSKARQYYSGKGYVCTAPSTGQFMYVSSAVTGQPILGISGDEENCKKYIEHSKFGLLCVENPRNRSYTLFMQDKAYIENITSMAVCKYAIDSFKDGRVCIPQGDQSKNIVMNLETGAREGAPVDSSVEAANCVAKSRQ